MRSLRMTTRLGSAAVLLALTAATAPAADLGRPRSRPPEDYAPPLEPPRAEADRWTGFYLGGTLGTMWGPGVASGDIGTYTFEQEGRVGTVFAGYNFQVGRSVLGLEIDVGTGNVTSSTATGQGILRSELNSLGSARARAGFLVAPALLLYGTAGLAWSNMDFTVGNFNTVSDTLWGYQVGTGAELMLSRHIGLRLEYIYTDLGKQPFGHNGLNNGYDPDSHTVRAGISVKF
jgi:outer membrane immunogenic protein